MKLALIAIAGLATAASAQNADIFNGSNGGVANPKPNYNGGGYTGQTDSTLWNNGGFTTSPGNSTLPVGDTIFGYGHQTTVGNSMGDDFVVGAGGWNVTQLCFYSYQTGSGTAASTFTSVTATIYAGAIGNTASPQWTGTGLASSVFTGVYRNNVPGDTARPIFENSLNAVVSLPAGGYWIAWNTAGTLASGPWAPPVTPAPVGANGQQQIGVAGPWALTVNGAHADELPFLVKGEVVPAPATLALVGLGGLVAGRRRR